MRGGVGRRGREGERDAAEGEVEREPPACEEGAGFQTCDLPLLGQGEGGGVLGWHGVGGGGVAGRGNRGWVAFVGVTVWGGAGWAGVGVSGGIGGVSGLVFD